MGSRRRLLHDDSRRGQEVHHGKLVVTEFVTLDIADGRVQTGRSMINPDKLRHPGPIADVRALLARRRREQPDR